MLNSNGNFIFLNVADIKIFSRFVEFCLPLLLQIPGLVKWWNPGYAGLLDFSNNQTVNWFVRKLENLKQNYSIDSFKFDAGN